MEKNTIIIGIGELKTDYIYKKKSNKLDLEFIDGGGTVWNILCNTYKAKINTIAIGVCGSDDDGDICIESLKKYNINVDNIIRSGKYTKKVYITIPEAEGSLDDESVICKLKNPITGEKCDIYYNRLWYKKISISKVYDAIVVIDDLKKHNIEVINMLREKCNIKVALDVGHVGFMKYFSKQKLISYLEQVDFLQLNNNGSLYMFSKMKMNKYEIFDYLNLEVLILTRGSNGVEFIWRENNIIKANYYKIMVPTKIVDSCGTGDAFYSNFIIKYIKRNNKILNEDFFNDVFESGVRITSKVVGCIGSRSHLEKGEGDNLG